MQKQQIEDFLAQKQIAIAGVSRDKSKFSNKVYEKLRDSGYGVSVIHPEAESIDGVKCEPSVRELPVEVTALMVVASAKVCESVLRDISEGGIKHVWVFAGSEKQKGVEAEVKRLSEAGVSVIFGQCPFMFLEPVGGFHAFHRFIARLFGKYPK